MHVSLSITDLRRAARSRQSIAFNNHSKGDVS